MTKLNLAFLWHMHQPYYRAPETGYYEMPWVRLHAVKDYYDMVAILQDFPSIHQTFNLVPSLLEQIEEYALGNAIDRIAYLTLKTPSDLTRNEKEEILERFFRANYDTMIKPYKRYDWLYWLRGKDKPTGGFGELIPRFKANDWNDLQVWYNLVWIDQIFRGEADVKYFFTKTSGFDEADKRKLLEIEQQIVSKIIPLYKNLWDTGQIEVTASPFYHPILPLLCDTDIAKIASPSIQLPFKKFQYPEDARIQVERAIEYFAERFGRKPEGMWPSEGSVSNEALDIMVECGIKWAATDEGVLSRSIETSFLRDSVGFPANAAKLYKPYRYISGGDRTIELVFRDHLISDLIGFAYQKWNPEKASDDLLKRLQIIYERAQRSNIQENLLVTVALDGENCWEQYRNDGHDFLKELYRKLSESKYVKAVTVTEHLKYCTDTNRAVLTKIHPGSWINSDFRVWIGHPEDNMAWELLTEARERYQQVFKERGRTDEALELAFKEILIAEGSDWCWWYGDEHFSEENELFDELFRAHLRRVYELLSLKPPTSLEQPIRGIGVTRVITPFRFLSPEIDGRRSNFYEWDGAGFFDTRKSGGAMHRVSGAITGIYYGFDLHNFFIRIDFSSAFRETQLEQSELKIDLSRRKGGKELCKQLTICFKGKQPFVRGIEGKGSIHTVKQSETIKLAFRECLEVGIPLSLLQVKYKDDLMFRVVLYNAGELAETWPQAQLIGCVVPGKDFEQENWVV